MGKELWMEAARKSGYIDSDTKKQQEQRQQQHKKEMQDAIKEMQDFLKSEEGEAAKILLQHTNEYIKFGEYDDENTRRSGAYFFDKDGFKEETIKDAGAMYTAYASKDRVPQPSVRDLPVEEAVKLMARKESIGGPKNVLPFFKGQLDIIAQKALGR